MNEDIILNIGQMPVVIESTSMFYNNRINLESVMDKIYMFATQFGEEDPEIKIQVQY
jgi:hypothetical protein